MAVISHADPDAGNSTSSSSSGGASDVSDDLHQPKRSNHLAGPAGTQDNHDQPPSNNHNQRHQAQPQPQPQALLPSCPQQQRPGAWVPAAFRTAGANAADYEDGIEDPMGPHEEGREAVTAPAEEEEEAARRQAEAREEEREQVVAALEAKVRALMRRCADLTDELIDARHTAHRRVEAAQEEVSVRVCGGGARGAEGGVRGACALALGASQREVNAFTLVCCSSAAAASLATPSCRPTVCLPPPSVALKAAAARRQAAFCDEEVRRLGRKLAALRAEQADAVDWAAQRVSG